MKRTKRQFSADFKKQILDEAAGGRSLTDLAHEHDLTVTMICRWKRQTRDGEIDSAVEAAPRAQVGTPGADLRYVRELEMKLRESNEKLGEMYVVVEGLKKIQADSQRMRSARSFVATANTMGRLKRPAK
jgi:transposase-like protein